MYLISSWYCCKVLSCWVFTEWLNTTCRCCFCWPPVVTPCQYTVTSLFQVQTHSIRWAGMMLALHQLMNTVESFHSPLHTAQHFLFQLLRPTWGLSSLVCIRCRRHTWCFVYSLHRAVDSGQHEQAVCQSKTEWKPMWFSTLLTPPTQPHPSSFTGGCGFVVQ